MSVVIPVHDAPDTAWFDDEASVEAVIDDLFARKRAAADSYGPDVARLWKAASDTVRGGKMVRPLLLMASYRALAGAANTRPVVEAAAAVELLHYAFILHDDVIDGDTMRRGRPNLIGAMASAAESSPRAAHWGSTSAILMGDLALSAAYQAFARLEAPHQTRLRVLDIVDHTIDETVAGELIDVALGDGVMAASLSRILDMSANKTACYTFELPLRLAAALAGATPEVERALAVVGRHLGLAFQLEDDLITAFGDPLEHGKDPLSDLREGKQTPIIACARVTEHWPLIRDDVGRRDLSAADAARVRAVLEDCGARRRVEDLRDAAVAFVMAACRDDGGRIPRDAARVLLDFASRLEGRRA